MGWSARSKELDAENLMKKFDVIMLQKTWCLGSMALDGYNIYEVQAEPSVRGRAKGGLGVLISTALRVQITQPNPHNRTAMALILKFKEIDCSLLNVYIPPTKIKAHRKQVWRDLEI